MSKIHYSAIVFLLLGMIGGYVILHPYTMLVYALLHVHVGEGLHIHWNEVRIQALTAFKPMMLPMSVAFIVFGGLIGLLTGIVIDRKRRLVNSEYENEKKKIALDTIKRLMVTLSHHLLNANMIIGGKVRHSRRVGPNEVVLNDLAVIEEQGRKIDAVIKSLREATEIKMADYTTSGEVKMLDIEREIEDRLKQT